MSGVLMRAGLTMAAAAFFAAASGAAAQPMGRPDVPVVLGEFKGTLPCADCAGIETSLLLVQKDEGTAEGSYVLMETFTGKSADPVVSEGSWTTLRGTAANPDDTVYELDPANPGQARDFVKVDNLTIRLLGAGQTELPEDSAILRTAADPYAGMPNPAAINCVKIGGRSVILEGTVRGEQGICRLPDGRECEEFAVLRDHRCLDPAKPQPPPRRPSKEDDKAPNY